MRIYNLFNIPQVEEDIVPSMPYMGSKRKLANKILNAIYDTVGDFDTLYDLFGGGGSMSVAGLIAGHNVIYNEYNTGIYNLMKYIIEGGELPNHWITRDEFMKHKGGDDWYSGFIKCVWSFGNNQQYYLFGEDIEEYKRLMHLVVVNKSTKAKAQFEKLIGLKIEMPNGKTILSRRIELKNTLKKHLTDIQNNHFVDKLGKGIENDMLLQQLQQLERLQRLQQLEQLEQLERLQQLQLSNLSYEQVEIRGNAVIYCDPPYKDTAEYQKSIDYDKFYEWALNNKYPVFISSYEMPKEFKLIKSFKHNCSLGANTNNEVVENLYWNVKII